MEAFLKETYTNGSYITEFQHKNSIKGLVERMTQDDFELMIGLAANAMNLMRDSLFSMSYKEALEKELERHKELSNSERTVLEGELAAKLRLKESEAQLARQSAAAEISGLRAQLETLTGALSVSEGNFQTMKGQIAEISGKAEETYKTMLSQREREHKEEVKERLAQCEAQYRESIKMLKENYERMESRLNRDYEKTLISSEKGRVGEEEFENLCAKYTNWGPMVNTSKETAATDRRVLIRGCKAMFEVKNYKDTIPTEQVNKFLRDMKNNSDAPLGVFISLHTNIAKKIDKYIHIEWTEDSQLLIYINHLFDHSVPDTLLFIDACVSIALTVYQSAKNTSDSDMSVALNSRIEQTKFLIQKELANLVENLKGLEHHKAIVMNHILNQYNDTKRQMTSTKDSLKSMVDILLGKSEEPEVTPEPPQVVSLKPRGRKKN